MWGWITLFLISILIWMRVFHYYISFKNLAKTQDKHVFSYGKDLNLGFVTGVVVVILDKVITSIFQNFPNFYFNSLESFVPTLISSFIIINLELAIMFCFIFHLIHKGFLGIIKKKKSD